MPNLKNYRLLISHSWKYSEPYLKVVGWLKNASYFSWSNHSVSADHPLETRTKKELREELTQQISGCHAVIVLSGMYAAYSEWIDYEISEALRLNKPIIGVKPWGSLRIPQNVQQNATVMVGWNAASIIAAIREYAL